MSDKDFHGAFVFRNQGHGILSSTYFNTPTPKLYPETAIIIGEVNKTDPFLGRFNTVWIERERQVVGEVEIISNRRYAQGYTLKWTERAPNNLRWEGIGNMESEVMIGCYWEVKP